MNGSGLIVNESVCFVNGSGCFVNGSGWFVNGSGWFVNCSGWFINDSGWFVNGSGSFVIEAAVVVFWVVFQNLMHLCMVFCFCCVKQDGCFCVFWESGIGLLVFGIVCHQPFNFMMSWITDIILDVVSCLEGGTGDVVGGMEVGFGVVCELATGIGKVRSCQMTISVYHSVCEVGDCDEDGVFLFVCILPRI